MKPRTNEDYCPVCGKEWDLCTCEDLFPEAMLIDLDEVLIISSFGA